VSKLLQLIDNMPRPELPKYFSVADREVVQLAIATSRQKARPYDGVYKAPWLLSDYHAAEWLTTNRNREDFVDGSWTGVIKINWAVRLPNGYLLTDQKYSKLLDLNKRIAFLIRSGYVSLVTSPPTWADIVAVQLQLTRWAVLHDTQFRLSAVGPICN
jgi:hypothetical protein